VNRGPLGELNADLAARGIGRSAAVVRRYSTGSLFEKDPGVIFPAASLGKLLIAVALCDEVARKMCYLDDYARVTTLDLLARSGFIRTRIVGEKVQLRHALDLMISKSDNLAANILIDYIGLGSLKRAAARYGLTSTNIAGHYVSEPFVRVPPRSFTSARDIATLLEVIVRFSRSSDATTSKAYGVLVQSLLHQYDRSGIPSGITSSDVANKSGGIEGFVGDSAIVAPFSKHPLIIVVLLDGLADPAIGTNAIGAFSHTAYQAFGQA